MDSAPGTPLTQTLAYRTQPLNHQRDCLRDFGDRAAFALLAEMGTGKTWIVIVNAAMLWSRGECDALLVLAPNGVQENWVVRELPKHMPVGVRYRAASWSSQNNKAERDAVDAVLAPSSVGALRILTMNWEAIQTSKGQHAALAFLKSARHAMIACDESDNMKNPKSVRAKFLLDKAKALSRWRRVMTGTPIDGTPYSAFSQYNFLDHSILGTTSYAAFKAQYAEMLPATSPLVMAIVRKGQLRFAPQIEAKDEQGRPKYRNLDRLAQLIAPHSFRVLKKDCLDLPQKIYKTAMFHMTKQQIAVYKKAEDEQRLVYAQEETPFAKLVIATKLSQITSGYYIHPLSEEPVRIEGGNPKLDLLMERLRAVIEAGHKVIIWARYTIEIEDILAAIRTTKSDVPIVPVAYYGSVKKSDRAHAIDAFERGPANAFVGNQQAGGSGITLVAASFMMYFSNNYSLRDRLQSEDRAHRIGQLRNLTCIDFVAKGTVDEQVVLRLGDKKEVADIIVDPGFQLFAPK